MDRADDVVALFSESGTAVFLSGEYRGHGSIRRLYKDWIQILFTQGTNGPVDGLILDHFQMQDVISVSADRKTAKARFRGLLAGASHVGRDYKPENVPAQFWEAGIYENEYVREEGVWKIQRLDYMVQWQADWDKGPALTEAHLAPAGICYPENPLGPDVLLPESEVRPVWPRRRDVPMHFAHPVLGRLVLGERKWVEAGL